MARTKSFKDLVQKHVKGDKKFAEALLREGVDAMLSGDVDTGKPSRAITSKRQWASKSVITGSSAVANDDGGAS